MKLLAICSALVAFSTVLEAQSSHVSSFFKYDPHRSAVSSDALAMNPLDAREPAFALTMLQTRELDALYRPARRSFEIRDGAKRKKLSLIGDDDSEFLSFIQDRLPEIESAVLKYKQGGINVQLFNNVTTTFYVRSGLSWNAGAHRTLILPYLSGTKGIAYVYHFRDFQDLRENGVFYPILKLGEKL
ncbi:MAG TPA: hypothetical protein VKC60_07880 [Opitutaceae bacterium]|nr:hypothetical protein [Opitutaceae bacterium]